MGYGSGLRKVFPNLTWTCSPQLESVVSRFGEKDVVLDLGAGGRRLAPFVKTVDFTDWGETDYVADVCDVPLPDASVDAIISTGLLEHVADEDAFLREANRLLKPGGTIHIEVPFMQQYHDDPIDCRRYTVPGLARHLERYGFEPQNTDFHIGPSVTIATLNAYYAALLFEGDSALSKVLSNAAFFVVSVLGWPLKFLDSILKKKKSAHRLAFGVYCTAIKKGEALAAA